MSDKPIISVAELRAALGTKNYKFFRAQHPFAYRIKDIVSAWGVPGSKISTAINEGLLPRPVKFCGPGKQIVTAAMIEYLFSGRSGIRGLPALCVDRDFIKVELGLKLPFTGSGSSESDAVTLVVDPGSGDLLADQDTIFLADRVWFKLTVWTDEVKEILPNRATIPSDPIDALKVLVAHLRHDGLKSSDDTLLLVRDSFRADQHQKALSTIEILAAKLAGGEAPYIKKCLWLALLAATLPWSKEGMLSYLNKLIEHEGGQKLSSENLSDRL
ncbi:MAG: hypothetical protein ACPGES_13820, partial [Coraliomargarita sp.]